MDGNNVVGGDPVLEGVEDVYMAALYLRDMLLHITPADHAALITNCHLRSVASDLRYYGTRIAIHGATEERTHGG